MEVTEDFKSRLAEAKQPVIELYRKMLVTEDRLIKAEIQKEIEDIVFPFIDELMEIGIKEQFENFATYSPPIENEDIFSDWKNNRI